MVPSFGKPQLFNYLNSGQQTFSRLHRGGRGTCYTRSLFINDSLNLLEIHIIQYLDLTLQ